MTIDLYQDHRPAPEALIYQALTVAESAACDIEAFYWQTALAKPADEHMSVFVVDGKGIVLPPSTCAAAARAAAVNSECRPLVSIAS